jgi:hypothetical protein
MRHQDPTYPQIAVLAHYVDCSECKEVQVERTFVGYVTAHCMFCVILCSLSRNCFWHSRQRVNPALVNCTIM